MIDSTRIQGAIATLRASIEGEEHLPQPFHQGHVMGMRFALELLTDSEENRKETRDEQITIDNDTIRSERTGTV